MRPARRSAKIPHGFDPPNPAESSDPANEYWASVIQGLSNTIVNLECGSAAMAEDLELKFRNEADTGYVSSSPYMTISQTEFSAATTSLTITGTTAGGSAIKDVKMHLVSQQSGQVKAVLMVKVLPLRTVTVGVYSLEDPTSQLTQFATPPAVVVPSPDDTIALLNDTFKQAGVQFEKHASSGPKLYPYDTKGITGGLFDDNAPSRAPDGKMDFAEKFAGYPLDELPGVWAAIFPVPANRRIFYVKNSGISYGGSYTQIMIRGDGSGVVFAQCCPRRLA